METLIRFARRLEMFLRREKYRRELDEEMAFHREMVEREMVSDGVPEEEAGHAARRRFGNEVRLKEHSHEVVGFWFESVVQDFRFALRQFVKAPGFALAVMLTLALGIGATTATFTLVYSTMLKDLPYPDAGRIVRIMDVRVPGQSTGPLVGAPRFFDVRERSKSFESVGFFYFDFPTLIGGKDLPVAVHAVGANAGYWKVFSVQPLLGRTFDEQDDKPNVPDAIVLSYAAWQQRFGSDPSVIGRQVTLDQKAATIVGVLPQGFRGPGGSELWHPAHFDPATWGSYRGDGLRFINVFGRMKPGTTLKMAQDDLKRIGDQLQREHPATDGMWQFGVRALREDIFGELRPAIVVLFLASGFLLLVGCVNVANLLLSRATAREREVALRRALGASETRIRLQFFIESTLLALTGGGMGLAATFFLVHGVARKLPGRLGAPGTIAMQWPVAWFAFVISVGVGIAFGLAPALQSRQVELNTNLKRGESHLAGAVGSQVRNAFIAAQVGLSLVLLIGASLLAESFWKLMKSPLGFEPKHALTFSIKLPWNSKEQDVRNFYANVQQRIASLPGVIAAGQITALPVTDWHVRQNFDAEWLPRTPHEDTVNAATRSISGDYLKAMETPLLAGRMLTEEDITAKTLHVLVNQQFVRQYSPDGLPVGRHLLSNDFLDVKSAEIVGVIGNVRGTGGSIAEKTGPEVYFPADGHSTYRSFVVRSYVPPGQLIKSIREQVHEVDPQQAVSNVRTMDDLLDEAVAQPRLNMVLISGFSVIALVLACVGIYGVVAYSVAQRRQEIGVRMALGATRAQISLLFVKRVMGAALAGMGVGICAALVLMRLLRSQLYGVAENDPVVYVGAVMLLVIPVVLATLRPARRAASVNPVEALRAE